MQEPKVHDDLDVLSGMALTGWGKGQSETALLRVPVMIVSPIATIPGPSPFVFPASIFNERL